MITSGTMSMVMLKKYGERYGKIEISKHLNFKLFLMSIIFMLNIVSGNAGIRYCSLAFVQVYYNSIKYKYI